MISNWPRVLYGLVCSLLISIFLLFAHGSFSLELKKEYKEITLS